MPTVIRNSGGISGGAERYVDITDQVTYDTSGIYLPSGMTWDKVISGSFTVSANVRFDPSYTYLFSGTEIYSYGEYGYQLYYSASPTTNIFNYVYEGTVNISNIIYDTQS